MNLKDDAERSSMPKEHSTVDDSVVGEGEEDPPEDDDDDGNHVFDDDDDDHDDEHDDEVNDDDATEEAAQNPKKVHRLSMKKTQDFNETLKKRGVIYVARIPPRMTPTKLKTILSDYGEVTRVFCQEEDAAKRKRRRKANGGGSGSSGGGSKRYVEGWVEYADKHVAKRVAASLHQHAISNVKRNPHYGDLWNLKYLSKFQWSHLTEKVAYERRVREQKLRLETMQAKRETASYKQLLEAGAKMDHIAERRKKRQKQDGDNGDTSKDSTGAGGGGKDNMDGSKRKRSFQVQPLDEGARQPSSKAILKSLL